MKVMKLTRQLNDIQNITLEEVLQLNKISGWCFIVCNKKIRTITIEK